MEIKTINPEINNGVERKNDSMENGYQSNLNNWVEKEKASSELVNVLGQLWYNKSVELIIFRRPLVDRRASQILNFHEYARNVVKKPISIQDTLLLAKGMIDMDLAPSWIDIGHLATECPSHFHILLVLFN